MRIDCVWPARAVLCEGPCWDGHSARVVWVDIKCGDALAGGLFRVVGWRG